jgi:hypothetical protein
MRQCPWPRAFTPGFKLLRQRLIKATHRAGARGNSHERLGHFSHLVSTHPGNKHLGESFRYLGFVAVVTVKDLGMEVPLSISGNCEIFDRT